MGTESFGDALKHVSAKIKSRIIAEAISFFAIAMRSGGHLAKMLEEAATSARLMQEQRKEITAATKMYVLFIVFIMVFASPVLFSLSIKFIDMMSAMQNTNNMQKGQEGLIVLG